VKIFFATAFLVFLITVDISAFDTEEQAYVHVERVSWCVKPEHRKNGLLYIHRSPDCEYKTLHGSKTIRDICEISAPEGWRTAKEWTLIVSGPDMNSDPEKVPGDFFFYLRKGDYDGNSYFNINWNANDAGEAVYSHAQWNLGEDYVYTKHPEKDIHTIEGHGTSIVLNFEVSLHKYPEPELIDRSVYAQNAYSNLEMLYVADELNMMYRARLRRLMKLKIDEIKASSYSHDYMVQNVEAALETQKAWEAYASARSNETRAGYGMGSGAPLGGASKYVDLLRERINEVKSQVFK
jgi:hypothetical protein